MSLRVENREASVSVPCADTAVSPLLQRCRLTSPSPTTAPETAALQRRTPHRCTDLLVAAGRRTATKIF